MAKKGKEAKRKEKKQRKGKKHLSLKPHEFYEIKGGDASRKRKPCPRCGPGTWLANHPGRLYCGKCGYTEFEKKQAVPEVEQPQESQERPPEEVEEKPASEKAADE